MSGKQVEQFEAYRRSGLKAAAVRKVSIGLLCILCDPHLTVFELGVNVAGSTHGPSNQCSKRPTSGRHCEGVYWRTRRERLAIAPLSILF